jgi:hypothetical protein
MSVQSIDNAATGKLVWRSPWGLLIATGVVGLLSVWPFWDGLHQMWIWWAASPEDNFGVLIPPVAAFLVWQQKDRLERVPFTGSWWGVLIILLGGACLVFGQLGTIYTLVQYAFVVTVIGLVLSFLGWHAFRLIAIPLCTLLFMIPLPQFVLANLSTNCSWCRLKSGSSSCACSMSACFSRATSSISAAINCKWPTPAAVFATYFR